jgi:DNA-binding NarL/FixJ family response regulator
MSNKIRVLLADDQRLFTESICTLISNYAEDIEIIGIAATGAEAVRLAETLQPQVILMDVRMPGMDGVKATEKILKSFPQIRIMMLSTFDEDEYVKEALHQGASGYLLKDISPTELIASIRAIKEGSVQISPSVAAKLVEQLYERPGKMSKAIEWYETLSQREREIFMLISKGYGNKQISQELCIAEQTVRNHVSSIYGKLGIEDRFQIIQLANQLGRSGEER